MLVHNLGTQLRIFLADAAATKIYLVFQLGIFLASNRQDSLMALLSNLFLMFVYCSIKLFVLQFFYHLWIVGCRELPPLVPRPWFANPFLQSSNHHCKHQTRSSVQLNDAILFIDVVFTILSFAVFNM